MSTTLVPLRIRTMSSLVSPQALMMTMRTEDVVDVEEVAVADEVAVVDVAEMVTTIAVAAEAKASMLAKKSSQLYDLLSPPIKSS